MIARTVDAGDNFKKRASIPLAPCIHEYYILISQKIPSCGGNDSSTKQRKEVFQFVSSFRNILALFRSETAFVYCVF